MATKSLFDKPTPTSTKPVQHNRTTKPMDDDVKKVVKGQPIQTRPAVGKAVAAKKAAGKAAPIKSAVGGKAKPKATPPKKNVVGAKAKVTKLAAQEVKTRNSAGAAGARAPATTEAVGAAKKSKKTTSGSASGSSRRGRAGAYTEGQKIKMLVKENPKREGSKAYDVFATLMKCKTVGEFYAKGYGATNLNYNEQHGYIEVV